MLVSRLSLHSDFVYFFRIYRILSSKHTLHIFMKSIIARKEDTLIELMNTNSRSSHPTTHLHTTVKMMLTNDPAATNGNAVSLFHTA